MFESNSSTTILTFSKNIRKWEVCKKLAGLSKVTPAYLKPSLTFIHKFMLKALYCTRAHNPTAKPLPCIYNLIHLTVSTSFFLFYLYLCIHLTWVRCCMSFTVFFFFNLHLFNLNPLIYAFECFKNLHIFYLSPLFHAFDCFRKQLNLNPLLDAFVCSHTVRTLLISILLNPVIHLKLSIKSPRTLLYTGSTLRCFDWSMQIS